MFIYYKGLNFKEQSATNLNLVEQITTGNVTSDQGEFALAISFHITFHFESGHNKHWVFSYEKERDDVLSSILRLSNKKVGFVEIKVSNE